ncbi:MAG TPA: dihydroxy-acid dehydratase, partial [Rhodospirillales bacterium]
GPLGIVRDGDIISLDVESRSIELLIDAAEFDARTKALAASGEARSAALDARRGYARLYQESVMQADEGADFDFLAELPDDASPPPA